MSMAPIEEALESIRQGEMVILVDDEDRENEGDLCMAAEKVTPQAINFMARYGRGLICLSLTDQRLKELDLPLMVSDNTSRLGTAFTVSIEARAGVTTGISAADRAHTIQVAIANDSRPSDLARPGHVFPLRAEPGGVLVRTGQTEGSVDLCRLAGLKPAGVICEIMRDDGQMARMPDLERFTREHGIPIVSVADLIEYRLQQESMVERLVTAPMPCDFGDQFTIMVYRSRVHGCQHFAVVAGDPADSGRPILVRVQHQCLTSDVFHSRSCDCGSQLRYALRRISQEGRGVVVYLQNLDHTRLDNVLTHVLRDPEAASRLKAQDELRQCQDVNRVKPDLRTFGIGAQILRDLGVRKMRLITSSTKKIVGLSGYGLEVVEEIAPCPAEEEPSPGKD
ncbi:MAG: 3,4-dihydroxy-2-butanone-4-phosphate synthase [Bradymonadales bacterium]|nr:3,4-dihydroxy-2-butanone-4-phosphate synthase [Bradymonadales bacterium]